MQENVVPYTVPHVATNVPATTAAIRKKVTPLRLNDMRAQREKIVMITAYDATFAAVAGAVPGLDAILVGDSLGMVYQGEDSTVPVSLEAMQYHTKCVARGLALVQAPTLLVSDLPFGSYHESVEQAVHSACKLMQSGAHMVKLEGGGWTADVVRFLVERGVPVCAHLGLTPQTVHALGGYRVQGRGDAAAATLLAQARELQDAGATLVVLEMVPAALALEVTEALPHCHTIGIGAGSGTAGQVLVMHDLLGVNLSKPPRFVKNFMNGAGSVQEAFARYVHDVKNGEFPVDQEHAW